MKIIDLLNKIANDEEVPEHIKYYDKLHSKEDIMLCCYANLIYKLENDIIDLTDEVEILDDENEEKRLPEKLDSFKFGKETEELTSEEIEVENFLVDVSDKINEIIDYLKKQRKGE